MTNLEYKFSNDLSKQEWYVDGSKILEVTNPRLTLNPIEFSKSNEGQLILSLFNKTNPALIFDGVKSTWHGYEKTWPASIDTAHSLKALYSHSELYSNAKLILDIGCGIGTCGEYVAEKNKKAVITFSDIEPNCIKSSIENTKLLTNNCEFIISNGFSKINKDYDLIIASAPPYIKFPSKEPNKLYQGTELLEEILSKGKEFLTSNGAIMLSISNVASDLLKEYGYNLKPVSTLDVPMRFGSDSPFVQDKLKKAEPWPIQTLETYIISK